mgnify:CR=1 FL=1
MIGTPRRRIMAHALAVLALALCVSAAAPQRVDVAGDAKGEGITVKASADVQADPRTVLSVITDYDHLARFVPYMRSSRVVQRDGPRVIVEQAGELDFLFFRQPVVVTLSVVESSPGRVMARAIGGNIKEMEGLYVVERLPSGYTRLSYSGRVVPDFAVPPVIGKIALRSVMERQFDAMVSEILTRENDKVRAP